jgi:hypothetical protein
MTFLSFCERFRDPCQCLFMGRWSAVPFVCTRVKSKEIMFSARFPMGYKNASSVERNLGSGCCSGEFERTGLGHHLGIAFQPTFMRAIRQV